MNTLGLLLLAVIPASGLLILFGVLNRWGRKRDPMKPSKLEFLTPRDRDTRNSTKHE